MFFLNSFNSEAISACHGVEDGPAPEVKHGAVDVDGGELVARHAGSVAILDLDSSSCT
jgi:hypothetical protein